jgi:hypothetical protein
MNEFHIDDYLANTNNWNFPEQIDYTINQSQFVELSNVHQHISLSNNTNSNTFNLPSLSTMIYDSSQLTENSSSNLRLKK